MGRKIEPKLNQALRLLGNGVFVIATECEGVVRGFTATWVTQASYDHPLLAVSVARNHDTYPLIEHSGQLVVNVLAASQADVASHFGQKMAHETLAERSFFRVVDGVEQPILDRPLAYMRTRILSSIDARDHTVFIVEVTDAEVCRNEEPLLYWPGNGYLKR